jgi:penicillin-binding protein 1C
MHLPAEHRAWASAAGYRVADEPSLVEQPRLTIVAPENNSRIWLNPETPKALARVALKAVVEPRVPQVVWYVDGVPFAKTDPDRPVYWPIAKGAHRIQLRLPMQPGFSKTTHVVVE